MKKILIYDSETNGHRVEFIEYLIDYFNETKVDYNVEILVHDKTLKSLNNQKNFLSTENKIKIIPIDDIWQQKFEKTKYVLYRIWLENKYLKSYLLNGEFDTIIFLGIDIYRLLIGFWSFSKLSNISIKGIVFNSCVQESFFKKDKSFNFYVKMTRKKLVSNWMHNNKKIERLFVFNDELLVNTMNQRSKNQLYSYLPDPIKCRQYQPIDIRAKYGISEETKILLIIGGLQKRKNIVNIIKAINSFDKKESTDVCLLILGKSFDNLYLKEINDEINKNKEGNIIFKEGFIENDELESATEVATLVYVVYSDFYCSSGIIGNAAKHGKPVIACEGGVIGNLTKSQNLGLVVEPNNVKAIKESTLQILNTESKFYNATFLKMHSHLNFVKTLLN